MKTNKFLTMKRKRLIFYILASVIPLVQAATFYFYVNFRSITLAFQRYDEGIYRFVGLENISQAIQDIINTPYLRHSISNSLTLFALMLLFGSLPSILFSYYICKKKVGAGLFKVILYLPHIISTTVFVIMYKYFIENAIPSIVFSLTGKEVEGMLYNFANIGVVRTCVIVFTIWLSFGTSVLMYSGTMSGISDSIVEAGKLDGITPMRELFSIYIPMIWPTVITFIVASIAHIFTNQMHLYTIYGSTAEYELYTFGYFLYKNTLEASFAQYPYLSAMGLLMTVIAVPVTLLIRRLMEKFGFKTE